VFCFFPPHPDLPPSSGGELAPRGRLQGPDLPPSREGLPPSYSGLKRGINHSSEIPNGGMQDAFLSKRTLCIHVDGSSIGVL
jgi:hypothetical protein